MLAEEALLDLDEEAEGDATSEVLFGDDEVGEARSIAGRSGSGVGDVVDVVCAVGVGQLLGGRVINLWENQRGQGRCGRGGGSGVLGEDCVVVGDT